MRMCEKIQMKFTNEFDDRRAAEEKSWPQDVNIKSCVCKISTTTSNAH